MQNKIKLRGNLAVIIMQNFEKYLNPIYKDIEEISNFKDLIPDTALAKEEDNLKKFMLRGLVL